MTTIDLAWDSGITDGDPGDGRIRVNAAAIRNATHLLVNAMDRHEAALGLLLSGMGQGDVLHIERVDGNGLVVAWVLGSVVHGGSYYKIPVTVRSADGAFAAHDLVRLHRQAEVVVQPAPGAAVALIGESAPAAPADDLETQIARAFALMAGRLDEQERELSALRRRLETLEQHAVVDIDTSIRRVGAR